MLTVPVEEWIGNAAAVVSGVWGAVTKRSEQSGYSRTAIYQHAERVVEAVANVQATGFSYEALWAGAIAPFPEFRLCRNWNFITTNQWLTRFLPGKRLIGNDQFSSHLHANR